jgi:hypothetical protein
MVSQGRNAKSQNRFAMKEFDDKLNIAPLEVFVKRNPKKGK